MPPFFFAEKTYTWIWLPSNCSIKEKGAENLLVNNKIFENEGKKVSSVHHFRYEHSIIHPILNSLEQAHLSVLIGVLKSTLTIRSEEENPRKNTR